MEKSHWNKLRTLLINHPLLENEDGSTEDEIQYLFRMHREGHITEIERDALTCLSW